MQKFIGNVCDGIEFTTKTHTKLQQEAISNVKKEMANKDSEIERMKKEIG